MQTTNTQHFPSGYPNFCVELRLIMPSVSARLRNRLDALRNAILDPDSKLAPHGLGPEPNDNIIPAAALEQLNIILHRHDFELTASAETNLSYDPPILFEFQAASLLDEHPIAPKPGDTHDYSPGYLNGIYRYALGQQARSRSLAKYVIDWTLAGYPRALPKGFGTMAELCNITPVGVPHALHPNALGFVRYLRHPGTCWLSYLYEYTTPPHTPHLLIVNTISCTGEDYAITHGELAVLVTAMRNRALQPAQFNPDAARDSDAELSSGDEDELDIHVREGDLCFRNEHQFPVLMLSFMGPQHGRIIYACMSGRQLVLRMSRLYSFIDGRSAPVKLFACALLSKPLFSEPFQQL
ncbi:hypothetical protein BJX70DRAFT_179811 [Aspergillus crustosus]